jgi:hypothetical protein
MLTKCTFCGEHARNQQEGNACHSCMKGIMIRDKDWEDNPYFLTRSELDRDRKKRGF